MFFALSPSPHPQPVVANDYLSLVLLHMSWWCLPFHCCKVFTQRGCAVVGIFNNCTTCRVCTLQYKSWLDTITELNCTELNSTVEETNLCRAYNVTFVSRRHHCWLFCAGAWCVNYHVVASQCFTCDDRTFSPPGFPHLLFSVFFFKDKEVRHSSF